MSKESKNINLMFSKYRALLLSISAFLLLIAALLGFSFYSSQQVAQGTSKINASAHMRDLNFEIIKDLFNLRLSYGEDPNTPHMSATINRLSSNISRYEQGISALQNGGELIDANDNLIDVTKDDTQHLSDEVHMLHSEWIVLEPLISNYLKDARSVNASLTALDLAVNQSQSSSDILSSATNSIATGIKDSAYDAASVLSFVQLFGILVIILYFIAFIFFIMRKLLNTDKELESARRETNEIMRTVNEGLFLLDKKLVIGGQYSAELESILGTKNIANRRLESLLESIISSKDLEVTKEFINQLFNERVKARLISDLNPLERVKVLIKGKDGHTNTHYLRFNFSRVYEGKAITRVLTSVADITNEVNLERRLELERSHNDEQIEMLTMILRIDQRSLASFVRNAQSILSRINSILERPGRRESDLRSKAKMIAREAHGLKGEASALDLSSIVTTVEELEDQVGKLNHKSGISGDDFLPPAVLLEKLMATIEKIDELHKRIGGVDLSMPDISSQGANHSNSSLGDIRNAETNFNDYFTRFVSQIANRNHKEVSVDIEGFDDNLPEDKLDAIKEVTIQLIRNSVVHGIEIPESRESLGKNRQGLIKVHLQSQKDKLQLSVEDDGQGIDFNAIKHKAVARKEGGEQTPLSNQDLLRYMFSPGFSTAATKNEDAGRGVGMDLIKARVQSLQGRISVGTKKNEFTRFTISFPK